MLRYNFFDSCKNFSENQRFVPSGNKYSVESIVDSHQRGFEKGARVRPKSRSECDSIMIILRYL